MHVWAVANQKGGVGKTTTAVTLAGHLVARGLRTLLVDLDPHGSMSVYFGHDPDGIEQGVYNLFELERQQLRRLPPGLIRRTAHEGLDLLPASTALATLDRQLGSQEGKGLVLANAIDGLQQQYDFVLMDCPPLLGILMVNALAACENLLIPVQTEFLALKGLERMVRTLEMITRARKQALPYTIIPTLFDRRTRASIESLRALREQHGEHVWRSVIPVDTRFREASRKGVPLSLWQPASRGARAYAELLDTLLGADREPRLSVVK